MSQQFDYLRIVVWASLAIATMTGAALAQDVVSPQASSRESSSLPLPPVDTFDDLDNGTAVVLTAEEITRKESTQSISSPAASVPASSGQVPVDPAVDTPMPATYVNPKENLPVGGKGESNGFGIRLTDVLPLASVLLLIAVVAMLFKRFMPSRPLLNGGGVLEVVARLSLSPKQSVVLVKMGRRLVLLGATADRVSALGQIDDPSEIAMLLGEAATGKSDLMARSFAASFNEESRAYSLTDSSETMSESEAKSTIEHTSGQVHQLLEKLRTYARVRDVA